MLVKQMEIIKTVEVLQQRMKELDKYSIGLVPTMGALHTGHGQLMRQARLQNDIVIVSIFVNPTQFGPNEDYAKYPRNLEADYLFCEALDVDLIFAPSEEEIYGNDGGITFSSGPAATVLCGKSRPGHFNGVLQIVTKLFMLTSPTRAYFGQKDAQQLALIEMLVRDYYFQVEIIAVPIVREKDGLAKSSRNVYLNESERKQSPILYEVLQWARERLTSGNDMKGILVEMKNKIAHTSARVDYIELLNYPDLTPTTKESTTVLLAAAIHFSNVRLIDNIIFEI